MADTSNDALKVFISYSRADVAFADELELFLAGRGFDVLIDRRDIDPGELWKERLGDLILSCDTVVFLLSAASAASSICAWEVEEAQRLSKRIFVVTLGPLHEGVRGPDHLRALQWIHCWENPAIPGSNKGAGFEKLDTSLRKDLAWLRQGTAIQERAKRWQASGGLADSPILMRGQELKEALSWAQRTPKEAKISDLVLAFITASEAHEARVKAEAAAQVQERQEALSKAEAANKRARRATTVGGIVAGMLFVGAVALGGVAWLANESAQKQEAVAEARASVLLARESERIEAEFGAEWALLMALQADPLAQRTAIRRTFNGKEGYAMARARVQAAQSESRLTRRMQGHEGGVTSVVFAPDGKNLASGGNDGTLRLWDSKTGTPGVVLRCSYGAVNDVEFSPNGDKLACPLGDGSIRLWDAKTGQPDLVLRGHEGGVKDVAFAPNGMHLASAGDEGTVRLWDANSRRTQMVLRGHQGMVWGVAFNADGIGLASAGDDGTVRLWNVATGRADAVFNEHVGGVISVAFAPDGKILASAGYDGTIRLWDVAKGRAVSVFRGDQKAVWSVAFAPDGVTLASAGSDGSIRLWDVKTGRLIATMRGHELGARSVAFAPEGDRIVSAGGDGTVRLWDIKIGRRSAALPSQEGGVTREVEGGVNDIEFSPDGRRLAWALDDGSVLLWNVRMGRPGELLRGHEGAVNEVDFAPSGVGLATAGKDGTIRLWDSTTGQSKAVLRGHEGAVNSIRYSSSETLESAGADGFEREWDLKTALPLRVWPIYPGGMGGVSFRLDGQARFTTRGAAAGSFRIWDDNTKEYGPSLRGHEGDVRSVALAPDGRTLASVGDDGTIRLWDAKTGAAGAVLRGHRRGVNHVAFAPDGKIMASAGDDGTVMLWPVPPILLEPDTRKQVTMACEKLWKANFPLNFSAADALRFPALVGEPTDPKTGDFLSPCRGFLPDEAFAKAG